MPGHGPALDANEAIAAGEADLAYLHQLRATVQDSLDSGASPDDAAEAGAAVEPPRPAGELGGQLLGNGRCQVR